MSNLNILIVEGNLREENQNFSEVGIQTHTESLKDSLSHFNYNLNFDVVNPSSDKNLSLVSAKLLNYDGLMIETHHDPDKAWSDAAQQITPETLDQYTVDLKIRKEKTVFPVHDSKEKEASQATRKKKVANARTLKTQHCKW